MKRRILLAGLSAALALPRAARAESFAAYVAHLRARALAAGIPAPVVRAATRHLRPNAKILHLDHHQAEFTMSWADYSARILTAPRIDGGVRKAAAVRSLLAAITSRFGVSAEPLLGIWGVETNFGASQGHFGVIDALATLAWDRQSPYFTNEAVCALRIIARGDAPASRLLGSYAGAMGQPQFMPSVYLSTAVSFSGAHAPDIWHSAADSLASMANYLAKAGWRPGEPSSEPVLAPASIAPAQTGRGNVQPLSWWLAAGVQRLPGAANVGPATPCALLLPDGPGGEAFLVYANFNAIRRYNPSDFYALAVGALGRTVLSA
ncbi:lytic transglycosylase domain-containing protein [Acidocella sp.]|uniref:lytic murein transglycosylase n=1 Tax=Acidocella sp. TaxID=50710 RepID=UPI00261B2644|nr:lytic murein transglycosylase [Acidocella sp.]